MRFAIIGLGQMGSEHVRNIHLLPNSAVVAVVDPHPASQERLATLRGEGVLGSDVAELATTRELLTRREELRVEAVIVCVPNHTHADVLRELLQTEVHILVEKPLCTTKADCEEVMQLANKRTSVFWVGMEYRYMLPVARVIKEAHKGALGEVKMIAIREHRFPFLVKVQNWNRFASNTGGTMVEKCCHFFDLMRLIARSEPTSVYCNGAQSVNHLDESYDGQTPDIMDNSFTVVEFKNGCRAMLDLCMFADVSQNQEEISVCGSAGKIEAALPEATVHLGLRSEAQKIGVQPPTENETHGRVRTIALPVDSKIRAAGFHEGSVFFELEHFVRAATGQGPVQVTAHDGYMAVLMGLAAERSAKEKRLVMMSEFGVN